MPGYDIGPFQDIVAVSWGEDQDPGGGDGSPVALEAYFWWEYRMVEATTYVTPCHPSFTPGNSTNQRFATEAELRPYNANAQMDNGLYGILVYGADGTYQELPLSQFSYSGIRDTRRDIPAPGEYEWTEDYVFHGSMWRTFVRTQPASPLSIPAGYAQFSKKLQTEYLFYHQNWETGPFCDYADPLPPEPNYYNNTGAIARVTVPINVAGGERYPGYLDFTFLAHTETVDFSGFSITWPATGRVYTARSCRTYSSTGAGGRVVVICT